MRAHYRPHFVQKTAALRRFFNMIGHTSSFATIDLGFVHRKTGGLYNISKQRALFVRFYALGSCRHIPLRYVISALSTLFRLFCTRSQRQLAIEEATRVMCFDRDAPCLFRPLTTTGSHDKLRYRFCNSDKKQLFHVKHRFLQCFSLEFYLLFALSCCRFV